MNNLLHPALSATSPLDTLSTAYKFLSTAGCIERIQFATGWVPYRTLSQTRGKRETGKHVVLFRNPAYPGDGVAVPEIALVNSHDGSSAWRILAAFHVSACSNGLLFASGTIGDFRVRHVGNDAEAKVIACIETLGTRIQSLLDLKTKMELTTLTFEQQVTFAHFAAAQRGIRAIDLNTTSMLKIVHASQSAPTLWNVFNRVQERTIRGGFEYTALDAKAVLHFRRARKVSGVAATVRLNENLFRFAENFLQAA